MEKTIFIPADVPAHARQEFSKNYRSITFDTGRLFLFAADHKIEHLDADFYGPRIDVSAHHPSHMFEIAHNSPVGALASQLGLIARFGNLYPSTNYIIKLNSKTNLIPATDKDPLSKGLWEVKDVVEFKKQSNLNICGVGYTVYLGSEYEPTMLTQAAQAVYQAHQHGLVAILWMYPRGKHVADEHNAVLLAGAAGVAACLGADFVKLHPPKPTKDHTSEELLHFIAQAAGNTKIICAGGEQIDPKNLIKEIQRQLAIGGIAGAAVGRNIITHSLEHAKIIADQISTIIYGNT